MKKRHKTPGANKQHKALRTPLFAMRVVKARKGKGSYSRKNRREQWEELMRGIPSAFSCIVSQY